MSDGLPEELSPAPEAELSRSIRLDQLPTEPFSITANDTERAALAARFDLEAIDALTAEVTLSQDEQGILGTGALNASIQQVCAISGEVFENTVSEELALRFVAALGSAPKPDEEIELQSEELDEIEYTGNSFDLGEAIAQTLGLAIDPFAEGPGAEGARASDLITSEEASGPFAALAALKKD